MRATILLFFLLLSTMCFAQLSPSDVVVDSSKTVEIELQNGSILSVSEEEIELQQSNGRTFIRFSRVREIRDIDLTKKGNQWFKNPN